MTDGRASVATAGLCTITCLAWWNCVHIHTHRHGQWRVTVIAVRTVVLRRPFTHCCSCLGQLSFLSLWNHWMRIDQLWLVSLQWNILLAGVSVVLVVARSRTDSENRPCWKLSWSVRANLLSQYQLHVHWYDTCFTVKWKLYKVSLCKGMCVCGVLSILCISLCESRLIDK